ncbi:hypothetical protein BDR05DRAFT_946374 [Suillus weaverae]|nr:hypothetical protein BDR05DRAFT_946374 [Suillus weaverae]
MPSIEFEITTRTVGRNGLTQSTMGDLDEKDEDEDEDALVRSKRKVAFMPSIDTTHTIHYRGHWLLLLSDISEPFSDDFEEEDEGALVHGRRKRKVAFVPSIDTTPNTIYYCGHWLKSVPSTYLSPCNGVITRNNDILKKLVLQAKREYEKDAEHRLHIFMADTIRTSGKTSLIHSLAGELGLDIYVVSLSSKG